MWALLFATLLHSPYTPVFFSLDITSTNIHTIRSAVRKSNLRVDLTKRGLWLHGKNPSSHRLWAWGVRHLWWVQRSSFNLPELRSQQHLQLWHRPQGVRQCWNIRNALASPLFCRRAKQKPVRDTLLTQMKKVFFFFKVAQSVLASTGRPVSWPTRRRKSSQELDDDRIRTVLEAQKEQLLAEAKSEILKYGDKSSLTEDYTRGLKCQIEFQELDLRRVLEEYAESRREQDLLHSWSSRSWTSSTRNSC